MKPSYNQQELAEWELGARNAKLGLSLSQSYKHLHGYDHDMRNVHKDGWISMKEYLKLKEIDEDYHETTLHCNGWSSWVGKVNFD